MWIEKGSFKIRKIVENYINTLHGRSREPITFPATQVITFPEVTPNELIPDTTFQFAPPAEAHLVREFADHANFPSFAKATRVQAPNVVFKSVDGQQVQLGSLRGRPVLIDVWATWCAPCISGFRDLARLYEETRKTGLAILSTDVSDDPKTAQDYLLKMGYKWPNFHDDGEVESAFGTQGVPRSILIDPDGKIIWTALALPPSKSERQSRSLALNMPQL